MNNRPVSILMYQAANCLNFSPDDFFALSVLTSEVYPVTQLTLTNSPTLYKSFSGNMTELGVTFPEHSVPAREDDKSPND